MRSWESAHRKEKSSDTDSQDRMDQSVSLAHDLEEMVNPGKVGETPVMALTLGPISNVDYVRKIRTAARFLWGWAGRFSILSCG